MKLVVIVPAYNEERTISDVVRQIPRNCASEVKVIVVDDGSTDKTAKLAEEAGTDQVISHGMNRGLGVAFKTGINKAIEMKADIIVNIDADGQFNPKDISKIIEPIKNHEADMVTCSRFLKKEWKPKMPLIKRFGNNLFTRFINFLTSKNFTDTQCGFRAYSREAALRLHLLGTFTYTQEVFLDIAEQGLTIKEMPFEVLGQRRYGKSKMVKNPLTYGIYALITILRVFRDYHPMKFFGIIGSLIFVQGLILGGFLLTHYKPYPLQSLTPNMALICILGGLLLIILALIADMNVRQRKLQEEILYRLKK